MKARAPARPPRAKRRAKTAPEKTAPESKRPEPRGSEGEDSSSDELAAAGSGDAAHIALEPASESAPAPEPPSSELQVGGALVPLDNLSRYLAEIRRIPILSREEEHVLAVQWTEKGDRQAAWRLVTANLRLVVMVARDYQRAVHNLLDLVQEGNVGLLEAVKQFDPYRGVRFPSYAVWWIRAYIIRYIMNNWRMVKVGTTQAQRKLFFNLQKERERLEREGFRPDPKLIADRLGVKEAEVVEMEQRLSSRDLSVDAPVNDGEEATFLDFLAGPERTADTVADQEYHRLVREKAIAFKATLDGKDRVIFERRLEALMRDEEPATLQEIGDSYGITRERVRQIEARLKKKLGAYLREQIPDIKDIEFGA